MILTGSEILKQMRSGNITIDPFLPEHINPNSYNYRLGANLGVPRIEQDQVVFDFISIPSSGYVLHPQKMYLAHTHEILGSTEYAMSLIGRSSIGRLGLFLQVSANLGHTGACHQWTLEIVTAKPFRVYPLMRIGQISFWENKGQLSRYEGGYAAHDEPTPSKEYTIQAMTG